MWDNIFRLSNTFISFGGKNLNFLFLLSLLNKVKTRKVQRFDLVMKQLCHDDSFNWQISETAFIMMILTTEICLQFLH